MLARRVGAGLGLAAALFGADAANAQEVAPEALPTTTESADSKGVISYPASFFDPFKPTSANDMVGRVPGFTFSKGEDVRGFGGAAGNVLIDGDRPSSKAVSLDQVLQRIPSGNVERIDVIRGGAPGIDMQGQPVVANVIRKKGAISTQAVQTLIKPYTDGYVGINPRAEQSWRSGPLSFDTAISGRFDRNFDAGDGSLFRQRAASGTYERGEFDSDLMQRQVTLITAGEYRRAVDSFRLNGSLERNDQYRDELGRLRTATTPFQELTRIKTRGDKAEIGGDYQRKFNDWLSGQFIGLKTFKRDKLGAASTSRNPSQVSNENNLSGETILRSVLTATRGATERYEIGGEGALNFLDARSSLVSGGVPVILPSANVRIEERRAEGFVTATRKPAANLSLEAGLRWEVSNIRQTGGANQEKTLSFPKPRLIVAYDPDKASQVRLRVERTVGQLNFKDFAANSELEAGTATAGNPDLEPERAWLFEVALERRFWGNGAAVLTLSHAEVQQVVDLIPIRNQFDAPGNIGDGWREEAKLSLTFPLDRVGVKGGLIRFNGTWRRSKVIDPVTGLERRISNQRPVEGDVYVAKTFPKLNSTLALEGGLGYTETSYRINEVRKTSDQGLWKVYWDWAPRPDLIFRFQLENFNTKTKARTRQLYTGPRSAGVVNFSERREAELGPFLMFRVRKTFS